MRQEHPPGERNRQSVLDDLFRQLVLLLGMITLGHVIIGRGGEAVFGLRMIEENDVLRRWTELADAIAPTLAASLAIAAMLVSLLGLPLVLERRARLPLLLGAISSIAAVWALLARFDGPPGPPAWVGGLALAAALIALAHHHCALVPMLAGAILCALWLALARSGSAPPLLEQAGESLLLIGFPIAAWRTLQAPGLLQRRELLAAVACAALVLLSGFSARAVTRHVVAHLFGIDKAGIPYGLVIVLLALGTGCGVLLAMAGPHQRRLALALVIVLVASRDSSEALAPLRPAAALALWDAAWRSTETRP